MNNIKDIKCTMKKWDLYAELFKKINMNIDFCESCSEDGASYSVTVHDYYELKDENDNLIFWDDSLKKFLEKCKIYLKVKELIK
jgi:hypothetical protein